MCLSEVKRGECVRVTGIADEALRTHLLRLGICPGSRLRCLEKIPCGPLMLKHHRQEIAVGREVADRITVEEGAGS